MSLGAIDQALRRQWRLTHKILDRLCRDVDRNPLVPNTGIEAHEFHLAHIASVGFFQTQRVGIEIAHNAQASDAEPSLPAPPLHAVLAQRTVERLYTNLSQTILRKAKLARGTARDVDDSSVDEGSAIVDRQKRRATIVEVRHLHASAQR